MRLLGVDLRADTSKLKFHLDCQEEQLKGGMRPGDKGYGIEPESHHGMYLESNV